jgi:hypothetical protein
MKTSILNKLTLILTLLGVLALNFTAFASREIDSGIQTGTGDSYDNSDGEDFALLIYGNTAGYAGSNLTLAITNQSYAEYGAAVVYNGGYLAINGGSITAADNVTGAVKGVTLNTNCNATLDGLNITLTGTGNRVGVEVNLSSTMKLTNSDISAITTTTTGVLGYGVSVAHNSNLQVELNHNTLVGISNSLYADANGTITLTGSNGSDITGNVTSTNDSVVAITLAGADTKLTGHLNRDATSTLALILSDGAALVGSGSASDLTLNNGAILGYTDVLTVTTTITIGEGITVDFSNLTLEDDTAYTILDFTTASGDVNIGNFTATGLGEGQQGAFSLGGLDDRNLYFTATAVPEPTTWFLLTLGLGALLITRRHRQRTNRHHLMKTPNMKKLTLILILSSALGAAALNTFAESKYVSSGTVIEIGVSYDNSDGTDYALTVGNGEDEARYVGTYITLAVSGSNADYQGYYGAYVANNASLSLTGGSITLATTPEFADVYMFGVLNYGGIATLDSINIAATANNGVGVRAISSTLTLTNSNINVIGAQDSIGVFAESNSNVQVNLNHNTLSGILASFGADSTSTLTVTGSNGSVITGDVISYSDAVMEITLTGPDTALHGNVYNYSPYAEPDNIGTLTLTINAGALLDSAGIVTNLTLNAGAILGYAGDVLLVTDSITIGDNITIDFSHLAEIGEYTVLDWTDAAVTGNITAAQFTATNAEGTFSVENSQLTFNATAIPEPSTWFLLGTGLGALALIRRRR